MSTIQAIARDALNEAHADLVKARRSLLLAAAVLALIHLLTVYPYLEAARAIAGVEAQMAADASLLARLEPEIARLQTAGAAAAAALDALLDGVTDEMIGRFAELRDLVQRAGQGEPEPLPDALATMPADAAIANMPADAAIANMPQMQMQQMPMPPMAQMPEANLPAPGPSVAPELPPDARANMPQPPQMPMPMPMQTRETNLPAPELPDAAIANMPQMQQMPMQQIPEANLPAPASAIAPELAPILAALAAAEPDAYDRLIAYARRHIVGEAYARADREWRERIRPAYRDALAATEQGARRAAEQAPASAAQTAAALRAAADEMARQRAALDAILISQDNTVDAALGTDWWRTVQGKGAYADAVAASIAAQMRRVAAAAAAPAAAIRATLALQEDLRAELVRRQEELQRQFAEQRAQLAALSGSGVVPVDLASFIGLFPLVLGLVLGFALLRTGQARHQAALAAAGLAADVAQPDRAETSEDRATRVWLTRRVLGGAPGPLLATALLAAAALLWIALAAVQVAGSPIDPPLAPWTSGVLAALLVLAAAAWDGLAIRRLAATLP